VQTGDTPHICYCLAPTRYVWDFDAYATREAFPPALKAALRPLISILRRWDYRAAQRVHHFVAISREIQTRIRRNYGRESVIIHPPVDTARFEPTSIQEDYYLIVSRLVPYKRIDLAVRAFNRLGLPLLIAGAGRDREALEAMANSNVTFLGYVPDADLPDLFARCRAFIFPGEEDFGIAPVQAMASGRPVIAYAAGGALDTVTPDSGLLFAEQSVPAIIEAVESFEAGNYDPAAIRARAEKFDKTAFSRQFMEFVDRRMSEVVNN